MRSASASPGCFVLSPRKNRPRQQRNPNNPKPSDPLSESIRGPMAIILKSPVATGAPGIPPRWTRSAKDAVCTAYSSASHLWFTTSIGVVNEIYFPTIDQPHVRERDLGKQVKTRLFAIAAQHQQINIRYGIARGAEKKPPGVLVPAAMLPSRQYLGSNTTQHHSIRQQAGAAIMDLVPVRRRAEIGSEDYHRGDPTVRSQRCRSASEHVTFSRAFR